MEYIRNIEGRPLPARFFWGGIYGFIVLSNFLAEKSCRTNIKLPQKTNYYTKTHNILIKHII